MKIAHDTPIVIYGMGEVGNNAAIELLKNGYHIQGFLDIKPRCKMSIDNVEVYQVEEKTPWHKSDVVVIVALANGNIHKSIAEKLYKQGYFYIVFLPIACPLSMVIKKQLIEEYNSILKGKCEGIEIYEYVNYYSGRIRCEDGIVKEDEEYVWAFVPQEILFSESYDNWKGDKSKLTGIMDSYDRNIVLRNWYRSLFRYYENEEVDFEEYFKLFQIEKSEDEKKEIICERQKLFQLFKAEFNRGLDFFIETAPLVEWNEEGYFNLVGGHHRTVFLLEQGLRSYPVKMKKCDFEKWCNRDILKRLKTHMCENMIEFYEVPIPHPAFASFSYRRENLKRTLMDTVLNFFRTKDIKDMSVLDICQLDGYFARIFSRLRVKEVTCCETVFYERVKIIFKLLYIQKVNVITDFEDIVEKKYDIIFAVNPNSFVYQNEDVLFELLKMTKKYMFVEISSQNEDMLRNFFQEGNYSSSQKLFVEIIDGVKYITYVLIK